MPMPMFVIETICLLAALIYIASIEPRAREKKARYAFDNRAIAFLEGLNLAEEFPHRYIYELRPYVKQQLEKAHKLPGNQILIEYTTAKGHYFSSYTGPNDYALFTILCIAQYAQIYEISDLTVWCESRMIDARNLGSRF